MAGPRCPAVGCPSLSSPQGGRVGGAGSHGRGLAPPRSQASTTVATSASGDAPPRPNPGSPPWVPIAHGRPVWAGRKGARGSPTCAAAYELLATDCHWLEPKPYESAGSFRARRPYRAVCRARGWHSGGVGAPRARTLSTHRGFRCPFDALMNLGGSLSRHGGGRDRRGSLVQFRGLGGSLLSPRPCFLLSAGPG